MGVVPKQWTQATDFWSVFGHSYVAGAVGTTDQTGRVDSILFASLDVESTNRRNYAKSGSLLIMEGRSAGGWSRVYQEKNPNPGRVAPYAPDGGGYFFFFGINDIGILNATAQIETAFTNALRSCISRCRSSTIWEDTNANVAYSGAGVWTVNTPSFIGSGNSFRSNPTVGSIITMTLPADYKGEPIAISFHGQPGVVGGTVTFSGTAGVTGTISTSNIMPSATLSRCPVVKRVTNLTSANAGQTIIATTSALDAGGTTWFDCWWIESLSPNPVVICNVNRLTAAGYAGYGGWTGTEGSKDAQVQSLNTAIGTVIAEFDAMVQLADIDAVIAKDPLLTFDGIHPNELGAAKIVDPIISAVRRLPAGTGVLNPPSPRASAMRRPRVSANWYTAEAKGIGTNYTAVAGDQFAIPFMITEARDRYGNFSVEAIASVTGTAVRWGIYDDTNFSGYPQCLQFEASSAGAFTITTGSGVKTSAAFSTTWIPDPALYWLVLKFTTAGTAHTFRTLAGPSPFMPNLNTTGAGDLQPAGWFLSGQGTGAFPNTYPSTATLSDNAPYLGIKIA